MAVDLLAVGEEVAPDAGGGGEGRAGRGRRPRSRTSRRSRRALKARKVAPNGTWPLPGVPRSFSDEVDVVDLGQEAGDRAQRVLFLDVGVEGVVEGAVIGLADRAHDRGGVGQRC